jgi:phage recombination protein Bet
MTTVPAVYQVQVSSIDSKKELIKRTFCKGASDDEMELFALICKRTGLSPEMRQIYPVPRDVKQPNGTWKKTFTFQTSIDGFRLIADRTGKYSPGREATYVYGENGKVISSTAYVKKQTPDGTWHEVSAIAHYEEYVQRNKEGKPSKFWEQMPHVMLAKCAESLALRKAFPAHLSGIYTSDEMSQSIPVSQEEPTPEIPEELTEAQCAMIDIILLENIDTKHIQKLYDRLKIDSLYDVNPKDFDRTISYLEKCVQAKKKEVTDGSANVA